MAKQQKVQQYCLKLNSSFLAKYNWDLTLPIEEARKTPGVVISLADSQILTWINELNGTEDYDRLAKEKQKQIKDLKKQKTSPANRIAIKKLYNELYDLQFKKDYLCLIIDKKSDYDRANQGFMVNGIEYKRLLTTTNGVKTATVVYTSARLEHELKKRIENGLNTNVPLVPAKKSAYQALCSSASIPVSWPKGIIVVPDAVTKFQAELIDIDDSDTSREPVVRPATLQEVKQNTSDGCSMMMPSLSMRWNGELNGDYDHTVAGVNLRCAWTKGMTFTFDYIEWAEKNIGSYIVKDVWGHERDIRESELIVTESQLKLWSCYDSWEDYYNNCIANHYTIRIAKTAPHETDDIRQLNYQFSMIHDMTDEDISELIAPTVNEIKDIMGLDYRKSLVYLCGSKCDDNSIQFADVAAQALMINKNMIDDPYVYNRIKNMIQKRIRDAKIGVLNVYGNFQIISGDLVCLCESMFGLQPKGVLKAGEIYSQHWIKNNIKQVVCYRAPMSNAHSCLNQNISYSDDAAYWFRYIDTCVVVNAWDTMPQALNGFDYDGDLLFTTDNPVLLRTHENLPALNCIQQNAGKKIVTEDDIIQSNKNGFGSRIGAITNRITEMTNLMANYSKDSEEYKMLKYRTQCGQNYQQNEIDAAKGIISNDMPKSWYVYSENKIDASVDSPDVIRHKKLYQDICAHKKPYFFQFVYDYLHKEYVGYMSNVETKSLSQYKSTYKELLQKENKTDEEIKFVQRVQNKMPVDCSPGTQNRICWAVEDELDNLAFPSRETFNPSMLKAGVKYSASTFYEVKNIYKQYTTEMNNIARQNKCELNFDRYGQDNVEAYRDSIEQLKTYFTEKCVEACPNEVELCDILIDICYKNKKGVVLVWDLCGETILNNLLKKNNNNMYYPFKVDDGAEFECCGHKFVMKKAKRQGGEINV